MAVQTLLQIRRGTAAEWTSADSTLSAGEWGYETDTGKYKIGDGLTVWSSLSYAAIIPSSFIGTSGIGVTAGTNGTNLTVSVTGITSSQVTDFDSAVDARVTAASISSSEVMDIVGTGIIGGTGIAVSYDTDAFDGQVTINATGLAYSIHTHTVSDITDFVDGVNDRVNNLFIGGDNIELTYVDNGDNTSSLTVDVTGVSLNGHTHTASDITDFSIAVTGVTDSLYADVSHTHIASDITDFNTAVTGVTDSLYADASHSHTASDITDFNAAVTGVTDSLYADASHTHTASDITDFNTAVTGVTDSLYADASHTHTASDITDFNTAVTGVTESLYADASHTHLLADITDVTTNTTEINYLDGTTLGTVTASNVVAVDANKDITGFRDLSIDRNLLVGGNLTVQGTTTTVNSTTVDIGDNIIQVNVSGAETQGGIQVYDHDNTETHKLVWDITNSRWEFIGDTSPDIYTSGNISANIITSTIADGTAPLQVTSTTLVTNLNADLLDGQHGSYYLDWTNISNKPDPIISGVLTGDVTGSASVTLTDLANGTLTINTALGSNVVGSGNIIDGSIINADINANADIAVTKLAAGSAGQVLQVNSEGTIVWGSIDGGTP